jgi:hypothetical protein
VEDGWHRVALVVERDVHFQRNPDLAALMLDAAAPHHPPAAADITLGIGSLSLRMLAIDLPPGCREGPLGRVDRPACEALREEAAVLKDWIKARNDAGDAFVVLGAFARRMGPRDPLLTMMAGGMPLARATEGRDSPCAGGEPFVDHILAGGAARSWMDPATLRVLVFRSDDGLAADQAAEHCAVSIHFRLPG